MWKLPSQWYQMVEKCVSMCRAHGIPTIDGVHYFRRMEFQEHGFHFVKNGRQHEQRPSHVGRDPEYSLRSVSTRVLCEARRMAEGRGIISGHASNASWAVCISNASWDGSLVLQRHARTPRISRAARYLCGGALGAQSGLALTTHDLPTESSSGHHWNATASPNGKFQSGNPSPFPRPSRPGNQAKPTDAENVKNLAKRLWRFR